ncbi:hypothetical protein GOP47_0026546 [Adiantum capillus-veneris]|nr:hypothetical protein GOP47_0026546 [Adiantum capillus-veneris]
MLKKIKREDADIPLGHHLVVLGLAGYTAWVGLNMIAHLQAKEEIFVSAAAGSVGLLAGQLTKLKGCCVVGSAGSDEKVKNLKEVYKYDDGFNYRKEDWDSALKSVAQMALENIQKKGWIVACGMISQYNKRPEERDGVRNLMHVVGKSLRMEGFTVFDYWDSWDVFYNEVSQYLQQGKISYPIDVLGRGIEEFAKAFIRLFKGENIGKAVLYVSNE